MAYMLDTDTCIYIIRRKPSVVIERLRRTRVSEVVLSSITLSELEYGVQKSSRPARNQLALLQFLMPIDVVPYGDRAARAYGRVRSALEKKGQPIGPLDTLIGAHALAVGATLVTNNLREFRRIPGLKIENWVR